MALTKKDLQLISELLDQKLHNFTTNEQMDEKLTVLRDEFYNKVDPFLNEMVEARQTRDLHAEKIYQHEERISLLEHPQGTQLNLST